ncbi:hypothetical protein B0O80DRAFT_422957 [Mortierella sp. GBAus27b]|nr:hypothetical protein B0O80DRAFT_422957 [Mortierella sp. GBAus27b]
MKYDCVQVQHEIAPAIGCVITLWRNIFKQEAHPDVSAILSVQCILDHAAKSCNPLVIAGSLGHTLLDGFSIETFSLGHLFLLGHLDCRYPHFCSQGFQIQVLSVPEGKLGPPKQIAQPFVELSYSKGSLSLHQVLDLANLYLENASNMADPGIALVLCHDAEVSLSQVKRAAKYNADKTIHNEIATVYIGLGDFLESRGHQEEAKAFYKKSEKWG